jgi:acetyl-CoA acetyltransferase
LGVADRTPVIAGIGLSEYPVVPDMDGLQHHVLAMRRALDDCGLTKDDIDGFMCAGGTGPMIDDAVSMAEYLRLPHRYIDGTMLGGSTFEFYVQHAAAAIRDGQCDTVLITYGSDQLSRMGRTLGTRALRTGKVSGPMQFEAPYSSPLVAAYAMAAQRHMHTYGTTSHQLAQIAVDVRHHASLNPKALYRDPLTIDDVLSSRVVADPLHKLDCCVISDGGGAVVLTTAERARDLPTAPAYVLGAAGAQTHWNISQMPDYTVTAASIAGPEAFAQAGLRPEDVDTIQLYDSFTITVLLMLEDLGFCKKGEGGAFVEGGPLRLGGALPMNTDGGGLSSCHPGMRGIFLLIEAVRQLRGAAGAAQVPDCNVALACGSGGWLSCLGVVLLGREHP